MPTPGGLIYAQQWGTGTDVSGTSAQTQEQIRQYIAKTLGISPDQIDLNDAYQRDAFKSTMDAWNAQHSGGLGSFGDILGLGWSGIQDLAQGVMNDPVRGLIGSFDPASTSLWNNILGTDYDPLLSQMGGPSTDTRQEWEANGGNAGFYDFADKVAGVVGAPYAFNGISNGIDSLTGASGAVGTTVSPASDPILTAGLGPIDAGTADMLGPITGYGGTAAGIGGAAGATLPEVLVTGSNTGASNVGAIGGALAGVATGAGAGAVTGSSGNQTGVGLPGWLTELIGPLLGGAGSYFGQQMSSDAAKEAIKLTIDAARPYNINIPGFGSSAFDPVNKTASLNAEDTLKQMQGYNTNVGNLGYNALNGVMGNPFGQVSPQYQNAMSAYNSRAGGSADGYINAGNNFLNQATQFNIPGMEATNLARLRAQSAFGEGQARQNNIESQYGKGILASTAGQYQTRGLEEALGTADVQRQQLAHQMAMGDQSQLLQNSINTGYMGQNISNQMFQNAGQLFGAGMGANQQQFGQANALYNQGQANNLNIGSYLTSLLGLGGNLGNLASGASGAAAGIMANNGAQAGNTLAGFLGNLGGSVDWAKLFGK